MRGIIDKLMGGVGMSRGRRSDVDIEPVTRLTFGVYSLVDRKKITDYYCMQEMKLPGEAWLEFSIIHNNNRCILKQTATFRPIGIMGRNYWYSMLPFHFLFFRNMIKQIADDGQHKIRNTKI